MIFFLIPLMLKKHQFTYTMYLAFEQNKIIFVSSFQHKNFYVDLKIHIKMNKLKKIAIRIPLRCDHS